MKPLPWWKVFIGNKANEVVDVANAILGTCNMHLEMKDECKANEPKHDYNKGVPIKRNKKNENVNLYIDWMAISYGFLPSLISNDGKMKEKSFNDPDTFVWFCQKEMFETEINQIG